MKLLFQIVLMALAATLAVCQLQVNTCFYGCRDCNGCAGLCCTDYFGCCGSETFYASEVTWVNTPWATLRHKHYSRRVSDSNWCSLQIGEFDGMNICRNSNPDYSLSGVDYTVSWSAKRDQVDRVTTRSTAMNTPKTLSYKEGDLVYLCTTAKHNYTEAALAAADHTKIREFVLANYDKVYNTTSNEVTTRD